MCFLTMIFIAYVGARSCFYQVESSNTSNINDVHNVKHCLFRGIMNQVKHKQDFCDMQFISTVFTKVTDLDCMT